MPKFDSQITTGNIVSWSLLVIAIVSGFVRLQDVSAQNQKDVLEAKVLAASVQDRLNMVERINQKEQAEMKTDIAVIKANVLTFSEKLDDIRNRQIK